MRFSMKTPWAASALTMRPFWYQSTCMSSDTKDAWHWKGRLSPWKTTWRWDGVSWKDGSSSGASAAGGEGGALFYEAEELWEDVAPPLQPSFTTDGSPADKT